MSENQWRLIITDSENLDGVAPVCPHQNDATKHPTGDGYLKDTDPHGVYDCCPWPQLEVGSERDARRICDLLNAGASKASLIRRVADLENQLTEAQRDAEQMRLILAIHGQGIDPEGNYVGTPGWRLRRLIAIADAAKEWQAGSVGARGGVERRLSAAVDAYDAAGKGETDDAAANLAVTSRGLADEPVCSCPEVWAGTHRTGSRNLSPSCPRHGEGTQWWGDFWAARAAQGSPRARAKKAGRRATAGRILGSEAKRANSPAGKGETAQDPWATNDVYTVPCPTCGRKASAYCVNTQGREVYPAHAARYQRLTEPMDVPIQDDSRAGQAGGED